MARTTWGSSLITSGRWLNWICIEVSFKVRVRFRPDLRIGNGLKTRLGGIISYISKKAKPPAFRSVSVVDGRRAFGWVLRSGGTVVGLGGRRDYDDSIARIRDPRGKFTVLCLYRHFVTNPVPGNTGGEEVRHLLAGLKKEDKLLTPLYRCPPIFDDERAVDRFTRPR